MKKIISLFGVLPLMAASLLWGCSGPKAEHGVASPSPRETMIDDLRDSLANIAGEYPGEIGIALLTSAGDTVVVADEDKYPLMSVFKLHQAISLCRLFDEQGASLDTVLEIPRRKLNPATWSPMLKDYTTDPIRISVRDMLRYTLTQSDNNASNYLFETVEPVAAADSFISTIIPRAGFRIVATEAEMFDNHALCYENHSSPLGATLLIDRLFTDSIIDTASRDFICTTLGQCTTGTDRIVAPLAGKDGVTVAHKTGSGFRNADGILSAHNDVAFVTLPDGTSYSLAVFVKDFNGSEQEAAKAIARISSTIYTALTSVPSTASE